VLTLLQASTYRADASIALVRQGQPPGDDPALAQAAKTAADLFHSRAVAEPAIANLRLDESPDELLDRVSVDTEAGSSLIRVSVEAPSRDEARRTAQELSEVSTVRFNDRFGPATVASVWEPARAEEDRVSPKPVRNLAFGALVGALLGQLLLLFGRRRPVQARRAPAPAPIVVPLAEPLSGPEPVLEPVAVPEPVAAREPVAPASFVEPASGDWTIADVERLLAQEGPALPELVEELGWYLDSFRGVAGPDGRLPVGVEAVIEDAYGPLLARVR
jgi:hypothetical protein